MDTKIWVEMLLVGLGFATSGGFVLRRAYRALGTGKLGLQGYLYRREEDPVYFRLTVAIVAAGGALLTVIGVGLAGIGIAALLHLL